MDTSSTKIANPQILKKRNIQMSNSKKLAVDLLALGKFFHKLLLKYAWMNQFSFSELIALFKSRIAKNSEYLHYLQDDK